MIDPLDPPKHPQGVPPIQDQYIKSSQSSQIAILTIFTYKLKKYLLKYETSFSTVDSDFAE